MAGNRGSVWTGADLSATGGNLLVLDVGTVASLRDGLPTVFATPTVVNVSAVVPQLPTRLLGDVADALRQRVLSGPGLAILTGPGLAELTDAQLTAMHYGLSVQLGYPMPQNPAGDRIISVRDEHPADPNARGYRTNKGLIMHTDAADVAGLLCLSQGVTGGGNLFASSEMVHRVLTDEAPDILHEYYRLWEWDLRGLQKPGTRPTLSSPIFSYYSGELSCRYASLLLREGAARAGGTLTGSQVAALDRFEEVAQRPGLVLRHTLARGESMWLNNYRVLHGREAFSDGGRTTQVRHLLRSWLWLYEGPRLASCFASPREVY